MVTFEPTVIHTERLTLRWFSEDDVAAQFAMFSDLAVTRYASVAPWTDQAQAREWIGKTIDDYSTGSGLRFGVVLARTGDLIGNVSLHSFCHQSRRCELGYALANSHWGKGYATEAGAALLDYAFRELDLNRVEADIDVRNLGSARVLERLGFRKEGYLPERWLVRGEQVDTAIYGLLKRYWDAR
jgi:RimJ/RimL family protein N-acetyltransferase